MAESNSSPRSLDLTSYRRIIEGSTIVGLTQVFVALCSALRFKFMAIIIGAVGLGAAGLFISLAQILTTLFALGFDTAGVKQISGAPEQDKGAVRRSLRVYGFLLAIACVLLLLLLAAPVARIVDNPIITPDILRLASLGAAGAIIGGIFIVELRAIHQIRMVALIQILASLLITILAVASLYLLPGNAPIIYAILPGLSLMVVAILFIRKYPLPKVQTESRAAIFAHWPVFLAIGVPVVASALIGHGANFGVRYIIQDRAGLEVLGFFIASFIVAEQYLGFLISAMGIDYFPRLSSVIGDRDAVRNAVSRQNHVLALMGFPVIILCFGVSDWVLQLLYGKEFVASSPILQVLLIGSAFKIISWTLGFVLLAEGRSRTYFAFEFGFSLAFLSATLIFFDNDLLQVAYYYTFCRILYFIILISILTRRYGNFISRSLIEQIIFLIASIIILYFMQQIDHFYAKLAAIAIVATFGFFNLLRLKKLFFHP